MDLLQKYSPDKQIENYTFSLNACIGKGSSGTVYIGKHSQTQQVVAIKAVDMRSLKTEYAWKMLCSEVKIMKKLKHPHVVRLLDVFQTKNNTYIITEFCNQGDLRTYIKKKKQLTESDAIAVISQIMSGLQELALNGIIHRDLKPANILIHDDIFKITDFGFAKKLDSMEDQLMDSLVGTPLYMAPQILNKQQYTSKCDVWSVGLILYELLYGRTPWPAVNVVDLVQKMCSITLNFPKEPQVSQLITNFINKCLCFPESDRISIQDMCSYQLFEDYVKQINRMLVIQKLQSGGTTSNTNSTTTTTNNLTDFASIATQAQNTQKNNQNNNTLNDTNDLQQNKNTTTKLSQANQLGLSPTLPSRDTRFNLNNIQQQNINLGQIPILGVNFQTNLNPNPTQQSSSMSPVRQYSQQNSISGKNSDFNDKLASKQEQMNFPMTQIIDIIEPYSPISPTKISYQKTSGVHQNQAKSTSSLQEQTSQGNIINSSQKNNNNKQNIVQYNTYNINNNYPSSFHNFASAPQKEALLLTPDTKSNSNINQLQKQNNYVLGERELSPIKKESYSSDNFYQLLNNANDKKISRGVEVNDYSTKTYNDNSKNQNINPSPNQQFNPSGIQNLQQKLNQQIGGGFQRQYTNEEIMSPTISPTPQYSNIFTQQKNQQQPLINQQLKSETINENMKNQQEQQYLNTGSPNQKSDQNDKSFKERGIFLQLAQEKPTSSNGGFESDQKQGDLNIQQALQPYTSINQQDVQNLNKGQSNSSMNNQQKQGDTSSKQDNIRQYSLSYQYQFQKTNNFQDSQAGAANNLSTLDKLKNQSVLNQKNQNFEQSPSSSIKKSDQHSTNQQQQISFNQNLFNPYSLNNIQNISVQSTAVKSELSQNEGNSNQSSTSGINSQIGQQINSSTQQQQQSQQQQQNPFIQQYQQFLQQEKNSTSMERNKAYNFPSSGVANKNNSLGLINNANSYLYSISGINNTNTQPKNTENDIKNQFNSTISQIHKQSPSAFENQLKKNESVSDSQQNHRSPQQRRIKSEFGNIIENKNAEFSQEIKKFPDQQLSQNQIQINSRNQQFSQNPNTQIVNLYIQNDNINEDKRNFNISPQNNRSKSVKQVTNVSLSPLNSITSPQKYINIPLSEIKKPIQSPSNKDSSHHMTGVNYESSSPKSQNYYKDYTSNPQSIHKIQQNESQQNTFSGLKQLSMRGHSNSVSYQNSFGIQDQQQSLFKQNQDQNIENLNQKYQKFNFKSYAHDQNSIISQNKNDSYSGIHQISNLNNQTNGGNGNTIMKNSFSTLQDNYNSFQNESNSINLSGNKNYATQSPQQKQQGSRFKSIDTQSYQPQHGHSKSLQINNYNSFTNTQSSQLDSNIIDSSKNKNISNEFYQQDNILENVLQLCKSIQFLKNQIDYNIKGILKLDEPFLYDKLIFLLNKHIVMQISMLKNTQMDNGINIIKLDRWTEYKASQNFNETYKKIEQTYISIMGVQQNNWNRTHENQSFHDEAKKDYYFGKIFNEKIHEYTIKGSITNKISNDEDNTNFYFYIYQLLKDIIKKVFTKLQQNITQNLSIDSLKITHEDSLVINCLSRLVDYHQLMKLIISQKEDYSLILKSINVPEFLKEKIITLEFYETLKQKMYIYDLIKK